MPCLPCIEETIRIPPFRTLVGFGSAGHNAGEFTLLHMIAMDSKGTLYASEIVDGRRPQFVPQGFGA